MSQLSTTDCKRCNGRSCAHCTEGVVALCDGSTPITRLAQVHAAVAAQHVCGRAACLDAARCLYEELSA